MLCACSFSLLEYLHINAPLGSKVIVRPSTAAIFVDTRHSSLRICHSLLFLYRTGYFTEPVHGFGSRGSPGHRFHDVARRGSQALAQRVCRRGRAIGCRQRHRRWRRRTPAGKAGYRAIATHSSLHREQVHCTLLRIISCAHAFQPTIHGKKWWSE